MRMTYAYDLRVQADYGREARVLPLNRDNMSAVFQEVMNVVRRAESLQDNMGR